MGSNVRQIAQFWQPMATGSPLAVMLILKNLQRFRRRERFEFGENLSMIPV